MVPAAHVEGLYSCLDYYQTVSDPFSKKLLDQYDTLYPGNAKFTAGSACSGLYRGLKLWEAAVKEAGSLEQDDVISGARPREDRRGAGRSGRDGARPASRSHEHVHRPGQQRPASRSSRTSASSIRRRPWSRALPKQQDARRRLIDSPILTTESRTHDTATDDQHHSTKEK